MIIPPRQQTQWVLLSALVTVLIAALGSSQGKSFFFICLLAIGPLLAALHGRPRQIALLSLFSLALAAAMGWRDGIWLTPDHLLSALVVAAFCGGAVHLSFERHREAASAHKREALLKLLEQVAEAANHAVSVEAALKSCLDAICTHSHWPVGHAWLQDRENPAALVSARLWHPDPHWSHSDTPMARFRKASDTARLLPGACVCGRMLEDGKPVWCLDAGRKADFPRSAEVAAAGLRGYFAFPVVTGGETAAVLEFFSHEARLPHPDLLDLLTHVGALLGRVVERQRAMDTVAALNRRMRNELKLQANRDLLTGFFNRRHLEESLERELNRASRRNHPLALVMFDLDHFKPYNDSLGHPAGDALLREFCAFLATRTRAEDILCRYGGDEFTLIMPETTAQHAAHWAEQLRGQLRTLPLLNQAGREVTVSFGVAEYPRHAAVSAGLIAAADAALYRAKSAGRDRVVTAQPADGEPVPRLYPGEASH